MAHQMPATRLNFSGAKRPGVLETRRAAHPDEVLDVERASQALAQQHGVLAELFGTRVSTTRSGEARWLLHCNVQLAPLALGGVDVAVCSPPRTLSGRRRSQYMSLKNLQAAGPCWEQVYPHVRRGLCCGHPGWRQRSAFGSCAPSIPAHPRPKPDAGCIMQDEGFVDGGVPPSYQPLGNGCGVGGCLGNCGAPPGLQPGGSAQGRVACVCPLFCWQPARSRVGGGRLAGAPSMRSPCPRLGTEAERRAAEACRLLLWAAAADGARRAPPARMSCCPCLRDAVLHALPARWCLPRQG